MLSLNPEVVWWWLLLRKRRSRALSSTVSSVVSSSSHLCLVSLSLGAILWPTSLLSLLCLLLDFDTYYGVDPLDVFPLLLKMAAVIIALKLSMIFLLVNPLGIVSRVLAVR